MPVSGRELVRRVALPQPVAARAPQRERVLAGISRVLPPVKQRCFGGERVIQAGRRRVVRRRPEPQSSLELSRRLAMGAELSRPAAGRARIAQDRRTVTRALGVKRHPGVVVAPRPAQGIEDPGVDRAAAMRGD